MNKTVQEIIKAFNELTPENKAAFLEFVRNNFYEGADKKQCVTQAEGVSAKKEM